MWFKLLQGLSSIAFVEFTGIRPGSLLSSTIYASVLTIAAVFVTRYLMRHVQESPKERENGERDEKPLATNDR